MANKIYELEYDPYEGDYSEYGRSPGGHRFFTKRQLPESEQPQYRYDEWSGADPVLADVEQSDGGMGLSDAATLGALGLLGYKALDGKGGAGTASAGPTLFDEAKSTLGEYFEPQGTEYATVQDAISPVIVAPAGSIAGMTSDAGMVPLSYQPTPVTSGGDLMTNAAMTDLKVPALYGLGGAGLGYASGGGKQALRSGIGSGLGSWLGSALSGGSTGGSALGALAGLALSGGGEKNPLKAAWQQIEDWF